MPEADRALSDLASERARLDELQAQLERSRARVEQRLRDVRATPADGTPQWRSERDALNTHLEEQLASLSFGDAPLCFGRLDLDDGERAYIGRVGLSDEHHDVLLVDWRTPYARPFYTATPRNPEGVRLRRRFTFRGRELVGIDDEVFDRELLGDASAELHGDGALLAAVERARSGRMGDIVATIQAEQDRIIRAPLGGVLVVEGGPGTGKTVVALHRAAYLLYTHRDRLRDNGVLVLGPNPVFLRYIEQVLPSLGETGVLSATPARLFPGVDARSEELPETARLKGDERMVRVIERAIADRQRVTRRDLEVRFDRAVLRVSPELSARARARGRGSGLRHNRARRHVEAVLLDDLVAQYRPHLAALLGEEPTGDDIDDARRALQRSREFRVVMLRLWPYLTAQQLLNDLFGSPALLRSATAAFDERERRLLERPRKSDVDEVDWTPADVPLLDEAAELLGPVERGLSRAERAARAAQQRELEYAQEVLGALDLDVPIAAETLVARYTGSGPGQRVADRAASDRTWTFGHVVVDEAQELSPMEWRMVFRRAPARSMTVVGDPAQRAAGESLSWEELIERFAPGRGRVETLTVNYRTPDEIMSVAAHVLAEIDPAATPPRSIRSSGNRPFAVAAGSDELAATVADVAAREHAALPEGRVAVIAPPDLVEPVAAALDARVPGLAATHAAAIDATIAVLTVAECKGLEFDGVVLVEPTDLVAASPRGTNDLYVALTRATQRLAVVHARPLPPALASLAS